MIPPGVGASRCPVCADGRVVTDEVMRQGTLRISECLHCEHRWTHRPRARWIELGARMRQRVPPGDPEPRTSGGAAARTSGGAALPA